MDILLNPSICAKFRDTINQSPLFISDETYKVHYNLFCAVMDRLDTSIEYINNHLEPPKTEENLLSFLVYANMVSNGIRLILEDMKITSDFDDAKKEGSYFYFRDICMGFPLSIPKENCPTDDKFFEFIRSVSFAHPFNTDRAIKFPEKEMHYSPFLIPNTNFMKSYGITDGIGIRLYSNRTDSVKDLIFSFDILKSYLRSRYEQLEKVTNRLNEILFEKEQEWRNQKVDRNLSPVDTLKEIAKALQSRYESTSSLDKAILYLEYKHTKPENSTSVSSYREVIVNSIPSLCDATDNLDYEKLEDILSGILRANPKKTYSFANYHLEKIYTYLHEENSPINIAYGLHMAELFANEFARQWVRIIPDEMSYKEIQLLVSAACYLEKENQEKELSL
ncbi:hypothetical protein [Proteiniclasticum ruminis]|uniref:Uncharacterized protein n=1 Tax=Proteiniclasticum ruminis TaxID=398199 RepID=A0A1G8RRR3_9CLOT|nr:hypothetical protein [Proteiniclasticum ruminis]SDJ19658.1 hypothetical protein SAMN05421804_10962 [Proteiniclasticum ruminis]